MLASLSRLRERARVRESSAALIGFPLPLAGEGQGEGEQRSACTSRPMACRARSRRHRCMPTRDRARELRRTMTDAELRLWFHVRDRRLAGYRFRRQPPIGPYFADFACLERRLVVELDGGQQVAGPDADRRRTAPLERRGWRVIRFWDSDVLKHPPFVLEAIWLELSNPHPSPLPQAGEGTWTPRSDA
jgi:adenine-specific DNA-methyltransferase